MCEHEESYWHRVEGGMTQGKKTRGRRKKRLLYKTIWKAVYYPESSQESGGHTTAVHRKPVLFADYASATHDNSKYKYTNKGC